ncbi:MAG: T9SS type A sorting domain-containing protein [Bacteroidota bacterium]
MKNLILCFAAILCVSAIAYAQSPKLTPEGALLLNNGAINITLDSVRYQGIPNSVEEDKASESQLTNISPNPASGNRVILSYKVGVAAPVRIEVINARGEVMKTPVNQQMQTGIYAAVVDISDLSSGTYHCRITVGKSFIQMKSFVITK